MTNVTTILGDESGIQYQGVNDASSSTGTYPIIGLIVGKFKRGRVDKPMFINNGNIKAMLGFDPDNPDYVAVQDALSAGVASIQVLRVIDELEAEPEPEELKPMIISGILFSSGIITCVTQLEFEWLQGAGNVTEQVVNIEGTQTYHYTLQSTSEGYGSIENGGDNSKLAIRPKDGVSKIKSFGMQYVYAIEQWWDGGYDQFGAMGMYCNKSPLVSPPNTTNFDFLFQGSVYFNTDISGWDMRNATSAAYMLAGLQTFSYDLSKWCVPLLNTEQSHSMFGFGSSGFNDNPERLPVWGTCPLG